MALEDAVHTALLTLKEGFEGQVSGSNIEVRQPPPNTVAAGPTCQRDSRAVVLTEPVAAVCSAQNAADPVLLR